MESDPKTPKINNPDIDNQPLDIDITKADLVNQLYSSAEAENIIPTIPESGNDKLYSRIAKSLGSVAVKSSEVVGTKARAAGLVTARFALKGAEVAGQSVQGVAVGIEAVGRQAEQATSYIVRESSLILSGLNKAVSERRQQKIEEKINKLSTSAKVHSIAAKRTLILGRPVEATPELEAKQIKQEKEIIQARHITHRPITLSQRRQARRAARRIRKNMSRAVANRNRELTYGEDDITLGSPEHIQSLKPERLTRAEQKRAKQTLGQYSKNTKKMQRNIHKIERSSEGMDIPGRIINYRLRRLERKANRLGNRADRITVTDNEHSHGQEPTLENTHNQPVDQESAVSILGTPHEVIRTVRSRGGRAGQKNQVNNGEPKIININLDSEEQERLPRKRRQRGSRGGRRVQQSKDESSGEQQNK